MRWLVLAAAVGVSGGAYSQNQAFSDAVAAHVLTLVNNVRAERGVTALEREARLDATATDFAAYMARTGNLDHLADGDTPAARVSRRGYVYCTIAENIAFEYDSTGFTSERLARSLVEGWRDSPTHYRNIMAARVTQTGLGISRNARGEYYAVQLFGHPALSGVPKRRACAR